ncbi:MAG: hypothetical protein M3401_04130 [Actinomycetota bacterium]|nr:hypothetical protein [Actinomycetota bacterium]
MRARVGVAGAVAALALGATAFAQAPAPPVGNFGGGAVLAPPKDPLGSGNAVIGMRALSNRKLQIEATVRGNCGGGTFPATGKLKANGSFHIAGTSRRTPAKGVRLKTTYDFKGKLTATGIQNGIARASTEIRAKGMNTQRCKSGRVAFKVRRPSADIGTPRPAPKARYYGVTSDRRNHVRRGIVMRVSRNGKKLTRALYDVTLRCDKRTIPDVPDTPRRSREIDSKGRVKDNVTSTFREGNTVTTAVERFAGTLGSTGAKGTLSITERTKSRKTGKLLETCKTGKISWTAAP